MKIKELLTTEDKWAKTGFAYDKEGKMVASTSPEAVKWCLLGATNICYKDPDRKKVIRLMMEYVTTHNPFGNVGRWNDDPATTFADVRKLVETLDI